MAAVDPAGNRIEHDLDANGNPTATRSIEQYTNAAAASGKIVSADLFVGPDFLRNINDPNYPNASKLEGGGKKKQVYVVGHEEQGHFMSAVTNSKYASESLRMQQYNQIVMQADEAASAKFPKGPAKRLAELQRLLGPKTEKEGAELKNVHNEHERLADAKAQEFVDDIKNEH